MTLEEFIKRDSVIDLSFFNFSNAITAAYFASDELEVLRVNSNFKKFFPVLKNVTNVLFPSVLEQLGVNEDQVPVIAGSVGILILIIGGFFYYRRKGREYEE